MKMSDKGVDSSEIVMLPSAHKRAMVTDATQHTKKTRFLRAIVVHQGRNWQKKSLVYNAAKNRLEMSGFSSAMLSWKRRKVY